MKKILLFAGLLCLGIVSIAQKLPNVQEKSIHAPADIKVDGKSIEWNSQLQAYNKGTEIFYTISNNNNNLYLTVQATDLDIINKIVCGGITFTINGAGKNKDQGGKAITFPELNIDKSVIHYGSRIGSLEMPQKMDNSQESRKLIDSFMVFFNKEITIKAKDIKIAGVKEIPDTLISIYNPYGIKAAAQVDKDGIFTCEIGIPLKYLDLSSTNSKSLIYNVKIKGMNPDFTNDYALRVAIDAQRQEVRSKTYFSLTSNPSPRGPRFPAPASPAGRINTDVTTTFKTKSGDLILVGSNGPRIQSLITPTDFWGEYTLSK